MDIWIITIFAEAAPIFDEVTMTLTVKKLTLPEVGTDENPVREKVKDGTRKDCMNGNLNIETAENAYIGMEVTMLEGALTSHDATPTSAISYGMESAAEMKTSAKANGEQAAKAECDGPTPIVEERGNSSPGSKDLQGVPSRSQARRSMAGAWRPRPSRTGSKRRPPPLPRHRGMGTIASADDMKSKPMSVGARVNRGERRYKGIVTSSQPIA